VPITNLASYLPTMDEFIAHWSAVNAALRSRGEAQLTLPDGCRLADFGAARAELERLFAEEQAATARWDRLQEEQLFVQEALRAHLIQFRDTVLAELPESPEAAWVRGFVWGPALLRELGSVARVWAGLETSREAPWILPGGCALADYRAELRHFRVLSRERRAAARARRGILLKRNALCAAIESWLFRYRCAVRFELDLEEELLHALPARHPGSYRPGTPLALVSIRDEARALGDVI
jgi:hypothetical protein